MKQTLEQILEQDCTNFIKLEKLNDYNKQLCLDFLQNLFEEDCIDANVSMFPEQQSKYYDEFIKYFKQ
jgi:hypothetical protein